MLLFWFFVTIIIYLNATTFAQPHFIAYDCGNAANYTENSTYKVNLDITLSTLLTANSGFGFYKLSAGIGNDRVNSIALCRGDVEPSLCQSCLNDSIARLRQVCPNQKQAVGYYDDCMLTYSNDTPMNFYQPYKNVQNLTDVDRFNGVLRPLLDKLIADAASGGPLLKFATGNMTALDKTRIYALVQCTPDLSQMQCSDCLKTATNRFLNESGGTVGGRALVTQCNFRYEIRPFFNGSTLAISPPPSGKNNNTTKIIVVIVAVIAVIIIASLCIFLILRKKKPTPPPPNETIQSETKDIGTAKFKQHDFILIKEATNCFSKANELGRGGFGTVYKGTLRDGQEIAVKRLSRDSQQGVVEFKNEVLLLKDLRHRNLVTLLGFSIEGSERLLIYEFLPNASLDHFIFDSTKRKHLDWEKRYNIIKGIAKGLLYLHEDSPSRIIHRDMKASNVLLDDKMNPKISDFGIARFFKTEETQGDTRVAGTPGYIAPECVKHEKFSVKSDVFSFGVLVLEMVTGQENQKFQIGECVEHLPSFAWESWNNSTTINMIDPILQTETDSFHHINRSINIGLLCVQENFNDRPTMNLIVEMLNSFSNKLTMPSEPAFFKRSKNVFYSIPDKNQGNLNSL